MKPRAELTKDLAGWLGSWVGQPALGPIWPGVGPLGPRVKYTPW
jgi:hypothetical protein